MAASAAGGHAVATRLVGRAPAAAAAVPSRGAATAQAKAPGRGKDEARRQFEELKQKFGHMGNVDHSKVGAADLFRILRVARTPLEYKVGLQAMNTFYNFGVKLKHREIASRLLAAAMRCKQESEAVDVVKLYGTWLQYPPDTALVYALMGHFLDKGEPLVVRDIAQAVREDWRMPVEPPLYVLAIEAMLRLPENGLAEALLLQEDARQVGVRLPAPVHQRLLNEAMAAYEVAWGGGAAPAEGAGDDESGGGGADARAQAVTPSDEALACLRQALQAAGGLARDGHLWGGGSAASMSSVAWLLWRLRRLPEAVRGSLLEEADPAGVGQFLEGDWAAALRAATENHGCHWGFSAQLPAGFFSALKASGDAPEQAALRAAERRFGHVLRVP